MKMVLFWLIIFDAINDPINNKSALAETMPLRRKGNTPASEPAMAWFGGACMCRSASMRKFSWANPCVEWRICAGWLVAGDVDADGRLYKLYPRTWDIKWGWKNEDKIYLEVKLWTKYFLAHLSFVYVFLSMNTEKVYQNGPPALFLIIRILY